ncbi:MAG: 30S ribosomal protein S9 [Patescibacteria group bacterium]
MSIIDTSYINHMSSTITNRYHYGVGRRKASAARAKFYPVEAELKITINGKEAKTYLPEFYLNTLNNFFTNVGINKGEFAIFVNGGGVNGQTDAIRLAMAKALVKSDETFKSTLRQLGYLTTDIRQVLPKRPGLRKARKREQWSKR